MDFSPRVSRQSVAVLSILFAGLTTTVLGAYLVLLQNLPKRDLLIAVAALYLCVAIYFGMVSPNRGTSSSRVTVVIFSGITLILAANAAGFYFPGAGGYFLDVFTIVAAAVLCLFTAVFVAYDIGDLAQWAALLRDHFSGE